MEANENQETEGTPNAPRDKEGNLTFRNVLRDMHRDHQIAVDYAGEDPKAEIKKVVVYGEDVFQVTLQRLR